MPGPVGQKVGSPTAVGDAGKARGEWRREHGKKVGLRRFGDPHRSKHGIEVNELTLLLRIRIPYLYFIHILLYFILGDVVAPRWRGVPPRDSLLFVRPLQYSSRTFSEGSYYSFHDVINAHYSTPKSSFFC